MPSDTAIGELGDADGEGRGEFPLGHLPLLLTKYLAHGPGTAIRNCFAVAHADRAQPLEIARERRDLVGRNEATATQNAVTGVMLAPWSAPGPSRRFGAALGCGLLLAGTLAGCGGTKTVTKTVTVVGTVPNGGATSVSASVAAGAHDFAQFACAQCHGERGRGGVSTDAVPALSVIGKQLTVAQLTQIINHGLGESANPKKPYMPVWGQVISTHQVGDLVAYIRAGLPAVPGATPAPVITRQGPAVEGALLYQRYGCVNCHGPTGSAECPTRSRPTRRSLRCPAPTSSRSSTPTRRSSR